MSYKNEYLLTERNETIQEFSTEIRNSKQRTVLFVRKERKWKVAIHCVLRILRRHIRLVIHVNDLLQMRVYTSLFSILHFDVLLLS